MKSLLIIITVFSTMMVFAAKPKSTLMGYGTWKLKQVIRAQNRLTQISNKQVIRNQKQMRVPKTLSPVALQQAGVLKSQKIRAKRRLVLARELSFSDYLAVYVGRHAHNEKSLKVLAKKMNTEQVVELLKNYSLTKK